MTSRPLYASDWFRKASAYYYASACCPVVLGSWPDEGAVAVRLNPNANALVLWNPVQVVQDAGIQAVVLLPLDTMWYNMVRTGV